MPINAADLYKFPRLKPNNQTVKKNKGLEFDAIKYSWLWGSLIFIAAFYISVILTTESNVKRNIFRFFRELGANGFGISYHVKSNYKALAGGLYVEDLVITAPKDIGGWQLKSGKIELISMPFTRKIKISFSGTHKLRTKNVNDVYLLVPNGEVVISKDITKSHIKTVLDLNNLQATAPSSMQGFKVDKLRLILDAKAKTTDFNLIVNYVDLPSYLTVNLPKTMEYIYLQGTVSGFSDYRTKPIYADWSENNGLIHLKNGEIIWKPFMVQFDGVYGLDEYYNLSASGVGKFYGLFPLLDAYESAGYISGGQVSVAKIVLGEKLSQKQGELQSSVLSSYSYQNGELTIGQVKIK